MKLACALAILLLPGLSVAATYKCKDAEGNWTEAACGSSSQPAPTSQPTQVHPHRMALLKWCESEWPNDFRMQKHCTDTQSAAAARMTPIIERSKQAGYEEDKQIIGACANEWRAGDGFNFQMVEHCWKTQSKARDAMKRERGE